MSPSKPRVVCVIPARYGSERFPGKPLHPLRGKPMVQWVAENARHIEGVDEVIVATDDGRIRDVVERIGVEVAMTPPECPSGTDRIQSALRGREADIVINVQGDEPGMHPDAPAVALRALLADDSADVSTACTPIHDEAEFNAVHVVKVVRDAGDRALYFSRAPVPSLARVTAEERAADGYAIGHKHLGLYVYRRAALEAFVKEPPSALELRERLEQLRFYELGAKIVCPTTPHDSVGVDTPGDVEAAERLLARLEGA